MRSDQRFLLLLIALLFTACHSTDNGQEDHIPIMPDEGRYQLLNHEVEIDTIITLGGRKELIVTYFLTNISSHTLYFISWSCSDHWMFQTKPSTYFQIRDGYCYSNQEITVILKPGEVYNGHLFLIPLDWESESIFSPFQLGFKFVSTWPERFNKPKSILSDGKAHHPIIWSKEIHLDIIPE